MQLCDASAHSHNFRRPCGLMDKALVFGTKDCRFESCQGHVYSLRTPLPSKLHSTRARGGKTDKLNGLKFSSSARGYSAHVSRSAHGCSGHVTHKSRGQPGVGALQAGRRLTPGLAVLCDISARPHIFRRPCGLMDKALVFGTKNTHPPWGSNPRPQG